MIKNNNIGRLNIAITGYKASRLKRNTIKIGNVIKNVKTQNSLNDGINKIGNLILK